MIQKKIYKGRVEKLADQGWGIVKSPEGKVYIHYTAPDELIEYEIIEKSEENFWGKIISIEKKSPYRIDNRCRHYEICGGCNLMHLKYEYQVKLKKERFISTLERRLKHNIKIDKIYIENPFNYRVKVKLKGIEKTGKIGFIKKGATDVFEIERCYLFHEKLNDFISTWNNLANPPFIHQIDVFFNPATHKTFVYLSHRPDGIGFEKSFGENTVFMYPADNAEIIEIKIGEFQYLLLPQLFFQVNGLFWQILQKAVEKQIEKFYDKTKNNFAIDLYSGVGFFTPILKKYYKEVLGVESSEISIKLARKSFPYIKFIKTPAEKFSFPAANLIFVDPPRSGLGDRVLKKIIEKGYEKIIYLSCSYKSLAKDTEILEKNGYNIKVIELMDMFPHTPHIESLIVLERV
jgi:23S rRNA (uracil1939-C5)-methyltransferase